MYFDIGGERLEEASRSKKEDAVYDADNGGEDASREYRHQ